MRKTGKVRFHKLGKFGYFHFENNFSVGDWLVCETDSYVDMGRLISMAEDKISDGNGSILRIAGESDHKKKESNSLLITEFLDTAKSEAKRLCLNMKMVDSTITLDRTYATFFFTANSRVDFRTLVRSLAHKLRCRIEMYQVRAREETKLMGGIGVCGQRLCCDRFLQDFKHISVAMVKNQNLNVSVKGIKGICGKLLCCLSYEDDIYREFKKTIPKVGTMIEKGDIQGKIVFISPLKKQVTIRCPNNSYIDIDPYTFEPIKKKTAEFLSIDNNFTNHNHNENDSIKEKDDFAVVAENNDNNKNKEINDKQKVKKEPFKRKKRRIRGNKRR